MENEVKSLGRGGVDNFHNRKKGTVKTEEDRKLVSGLLQEVCTVYKMPKVKNDEELGQRINDYFAMCADSGQIPTVEEMVMSTGFSYAVVWDWETGRRKGFSPNTAEVIKKAKDFLKTFDAKLVVSGKLNFLTYCFRAKNYYGMVDKQEYVLTPNNPLESVTTLEDVQRLVEGSIPEDD